jgi:type IV secretory pathway VirB2 component (pilin)
MVSVPLVVVLGVVVLFAYRYMGLRVWHAVVALLFGFFLAATNVAPEIRHSVESFLTWLKIYARQ